MKERYNAIDSLKGWAMLLIIFTHYDWNEVQRLNPIFPFFVDMAVPTMMFCTGYLWAIGGGEDDLYNIGKWYKKLMRVLMPFVISFVPDCYYACKTGVVTSFLSAVNLFIIGGRGPGAYYVPIMIQMIFLFPIIYGFIRRYRERGLLICFVSSIIMELCKNAMYISSDTYRLLAFRYIFVVSAGCYWYLYGRLYFENEKKCRINMIIVLINMFILGVIFISLYVYSAWTPIILNYWTRTSCIACMYIIPIIVLYIRVIPRIPVIELVGKHSWGVFLVQKLYYKNLSALIYDKVDSIFVHILIGIIISIVLGSIFDIITSIVTKTFSHRADVA